MKFNILINATENWSDSCDQAFGMCQTIIDEGHEIGLVFFYGQSVNIISTENSLIQWQNWQQSNAVPLCLCSSMLENENLLNVAEKTSHFKIVGLASWVNSLNKVDKYIEFS